MTLKLDRSKLVRGLAKQDKLVPHLERAIGEGELEWSLSFNAKKGDEAWHPSSDCTPSLNELYLQAKGELETRPITSGHRKAFACGHFWHGYLQYITVEQLGFAKWPNIERKGHSRWGNEPFQYAQGAADIAPVEIPNHGEYLVDIKTMNTFDYRQRSLPDWCRAKYIAQANIYMYWFEIPRAIILCVQKDSPHDMREVELKFNLPLAEAIHQKWMLVSECLQEDVEPPANAPFDLPFSDEDIIRA